MTSKVGAVFEANTPQELAERYDDLAGSYDDELATDVSPQRAVEVLVRYVAIEARILDAGCGTGKIGQLLYERGNRKLEGLDISPAMLQEARKKRCYTALYQEALGGTLALPTAAFDAVVCVGVFVRGHAPSSSFDDLIRVTRPGGHIIFTLRPEFYAGTDFKDKMATLTDVGRWRWVETGEPFDTSIKDFPGINLQVWVYEVIRAA